jgi:hypothetical protein
MPPEVQKFPQLFTPAEASKLLRVTAGTLAVWRSTKRYPELQFVKMGASVLYRESDLMAFLALRTRGNSTSPNRRKNRRSRS